MYYVNYIGIFKDILINLVSLYFFAYLIVYRYYGNKELFATCTLFNISLLLVVMVIVRTDFNLAVGFGLFALLSLITVRSAPFSMTEMAHFFGAMALAVINGSGITDYVFVLVCNALVVLTAWYLNRWSSSQTSNIGIGKRTRTLSVVLDRVYPEATADPEKMRARLTKAYRVPVVGYAITEIDHVRDLMKLSLTCGSPIESSSHTVSSSSTTQKLPDQKRASVARKNTSRHGSAQPARVLTRQRAASRQQASQPVSARTRAPLR